MKIPDITESGRPELQPSMSVAQYRPPTAGELAAPAQALGEFGHAVQAQADHIAFLQAEDRYTQLRNWQLNTLYGDKGLLTLKGAASVNGPSMQQASDQFQTAAQQFGDGLTGTAQQAYQLRAAAAGMQFKEQVIRHKTMESMAWGGEVVNHGIQSEIDQIGANYGNDNLIGASLVRINGLIEDHGTDPNVGWSRGQIDDAKRDALQKAETARWQAWSLDDPVGAYANFKAHSNLITDPAARVKLDHELKSLSYPVQADAIATKVNADATTHHVLTGAIVPGGPTDGFKGDPQAISNQLARALADPNLMRVSPEVQQGRDAERLRILQSELAKNPNDPALQAEIANTQKALSAGTPFNGSLNASEQQRPASQAPAVATTPGGMAGKTDVMAQLAKMQAAVHDAAGGDVALEQHALQALHGKLSNMVQAQDAITRQNHDTVLRDLTFDGSPGPTTVAQLSPSAQAAYAQLTPDQQMAMQAHMRESASLQRGELMHSDPATFRSLLGRIYLDPGDPNQIRTRSDLMAYVQSNSITYADFEHLSGEIDKAHTPEGNLFGKKVLFAKETAHKMLTSALSPFSLDYPHAEEASYRYGIQLDKKIDAMRAAGKDPNSLFESNSPDYVMSPTYVASFMPSEAEIVADKARIAANAKRPAAPAQSAYPTATNPRTGERIQFKDGKWQPLQ